MKTRQYAMRWALFGLLAALGPACRAAQAAGSAAEREAMVRLVADYEPRHKVTDARVLSAMRKVERHLFVPEEIAPRAYEDTPLPIGEGQTISQPFIVGTMTQMIRPRPTDRILEIGTGSGYQAALLAELAGEVYSIEIVEALGRRARALLKKLGYKNVKVRIGDGYRGWPEKAPFDAIIVTCAPDHVPQPLVDQLKMGGRLAIPVGPEVGSRPWVPQELLLIRKTRKGLVREKAMDVRFVSMQGEARRRKP